MTTAIAVPIGTAFALGCRGWRSRISRLGLWTMLVAFATPPIALGVALWLLFAYPLRHFPFGRFGWFGTRAQVVGLVTMFLHLATLVVFERLLLIGRDQEEMAADLALRLARPCEERLFHSSARRSSHRLLSCSPVHSASSWW